MVCETRQTVVMQNDRDYVEVILLYLDRFTVSCLKVLQR